MISSPKTLPCKCTSVLFAGLPEQGSPPVVPMPTEHHMVEGEEGEEEGGGRTRRAQRKEGDKRKRRLKVIVNRYSFICFYF
jgi:hypothetical protein